MMKEYLVDKKADLTSPELSPDLNEVMPKLLSFQRENIGQILFRKIVNFLRRCKLKEQVLFFTIRKDGELEGNAKALYPLSAAFSIASEPACHSVVACVRGV